MSAFLPVGGRGHRAHVTYAPRVPGLHDAATQSFDMPNGLIVVTDAMNDPELAIRLAGASTFDSDVNYDGAVDFADLVMLDDNLGYVAGTPGYDPTADVNGDGRIDFGDFGPLNLEFGRTRTSPPPVLLATSDENSAHKAATLSGHQFAQTPTRMLLDDRSAPTTGLTAPTDTLFDSTPDAEPDGLTATAGMHDLLPLLAAGWLEEAQNDERDESATAAPSVASVAMDESI